MHEDDQGHWVDKNSGFPIPKIEFDTDEGFDESGRKQSSREVVLEDFETSFLKEMQRHLFQENITIHQKQEQCMILLLY